MYVCFLSFLFGLEKNKRRFKGTGAGETDEPMDILYPTGRCMYTLEPKQMPFCHIRKPAVTISWRRRNEITPFPGSQPSIRKSLSKSCLPASKVGVACSTNVRLDSSGSALVLQHFLPDKSCSTSRPGAEVEHLFGANV